VTQLSRKTGASNERQLRDIDRIVAPRRFRLHWLSWIVLFLMTAAMTVIIVPGSTGRSVEYERRQCLNMHTGEFYWTDYDYIEVSTWIHGWPIEYLRRSFSERGYLIDFDGRPIAWTSLSAWDVSGTVYAFDPYKLSADLIIGAVVIMVAVAACEAWRRRRNGWRFSLLDVGVFATLVCLVFGWWQYHVQTRTTEQSIVASMTARGSFSKPLTASTDSPRAHFDYSGPKWLKRLVGNPELLRFCHHVVALQLDANLLSTDDLREIRQLTYVESVQLGNSLTETLVDAFARLPRLQELDGTGFRFGGGEPFTDPIVTTFELPLIARLPKLKVLKLGKCKLAPNDFHILAQLPRLTTLQFSDRDCLIEDLEPLIKCNTLTVVYPDLTATQQERDAFGAAHPELQIRWPRLLGLEHFIRPDRTSTAWDVAAVLYQRWQDEDHLVGDQQLEPEPGSIDLTGIRLTTQRVKRLPSTALAEVEHIALGEVDSSKTAMDLISQCPKLDYLYAPYVAFSVGDIFQLAELKEMEELVMQQGSLTPKEFSRLRQLPRLKTLEIFGSSFNYQEAKQIAEAFPGAYVDVYRGFDDESNNSILYESNLYEAFTE
jgi:hypothetical protein